MTKLHQLKKPFHHKLHEDAITWKCFSHCEAFQHDRYDRWCWTLLFSLLLFWTNCWKKNELLVIWDAMAPQWKAASVHIWLIRVPSYCNPLNGYRNGHFSQHSHTRSIRTGTWHWSQLRNHGLDEGCSCDRTKKYTAGFVWCPVTVT